MLKFRKKERKMEHELKLQSKFFLKKSFLN